MVKPSQRLLWYKDRQTGLGDAFVAHLRQAFEAIRTRPLSLPRLEYYSGPHDIRRIVVQRFPYVAIFRHRDKEVLVIAVAHSRRRPLYWLTRLS